MKDCLFCQIAAGNHSAHFVYEDEDTMAFLDHRPLFFGHTLLIPRLHFETLPDLPGELVSPLFTAAQLLSRAVEAAMKAQGTFIAINNKVSQSVPHLHVHVIPRSRKDGMRGFFWPRHQYKDDAATAEVQEAIVAAVRDIKGRS